MDHLLNALRGNWGLEGDAPADPSTLAGLIALARSGVNRDEILESACLVRERARQAAAETRRDLERPLDAELADALAALAEAFDCTVAILDEVETQPLDSLLPVLDEARQEIAHWSQFLDEWSRTPVPSCPKCGSRGPEEVCRVCGLDRLVPDPEAGQETRETAVLGPQYVAAYQAYLAVVDGRANLTRLMAALDPLEAYLAQVARLAGMHSAEVEAAALRSLDGVAEMRRVRSTRLTRNLHRGWDRIFHGARELRDAMPDLLRAAGRHEEATRLERTRHSEDGVSLGF
ncbi:MAG: hypothetical protein AB1758_07720 [Candidatus Eremiobacterota bacterium]